MTKALKNEVFSAKFVQIDLKMEENVAKMIKNDGKQMRGRGTIHIYMQFTAGYCPGSKNSAREMVSNFTRYGLSVMVSSV